jgi:hypothetical protein
MADPFPQKFCRGITVSPDLTTSSNELFCISVPLSIKSRLGCKTLGGFSGFSVLSSEQTSEAYGNRWFGQLPNFDS